jgi:hypothetical protein
VGWGLYLSTKIAYSIGGLLAAVLSWVFFIPLIYWPFHAGFIEGWWTPALLLFVSPMIGAIPIWVGALLDQDLGRKLFN